jgi:hypothetical protein
MSYINEAIGLYVGLIVTAGAAGVIYNVIMGYQVNVAEKEKYKSRVIKCIVATILATVAVSLKEAIATYY